MRGAVRRLVRVGAFALLKISRLAERVGRSLAVATLTRAEIDALGVAEWEAFGERGTVVGPEPFAWETELFGQQIRPGESVLVAGAGTGRDVMPLLEAGHPVTALDITPRALTQLRERAAARGLSVEIVHSSITTATLPPAAFDVVLFSWFCFGYLQGPEERRAALLKSEAALRRGGRILVSYPSRPTGLGGSLASVVSSLGRVTARLLGGLEARKGDEFIVSGTSTTPSVFFTHFFEPGDIEEEARRSGLVVTFHAQPTSGVGIAVLTRREGIAR